MFAGTFSYWALLCLTDAKFAHHKSSICIPITPQTVKIQPIFANFEQNRHYNVLQFNKLMDGFSHLKKDVDNQRSRYQKLLVVASRKMVTVNRASGVQNQILTKLFQIISCRSLAVFGTSWVQTTLIFCIPWSRFHMWWFFDNEQTCSNCSSLYTIEFVSISFYLNYNIKYFNVQQ